MTSPRKIMVVDDSDDNREAVRDLLRFMSFEVQEARDGADALQKTAGFTPDVFLIDVRMPKVSGLELLEQLELSAHKYEAIMMTGFECLEDARKAMELGALSYLRKPVSHKDLSEQVGKAIDKIVERENEKQQVKKLKREISHHSRKLKETFKMAEFQRKRFDLIIDNIQEPLFTLDNSLQVMMINRAAELAFNISMPDELEQPLEKLLPFALPDALNEFLRMDHRIQPGNSATYTINNDNRYWSVSVSQLVTQNHQPAGFVLIFSDQSANIRAAQLRDSFLSIVSHEFKSPLLIMMNSVAMLNMQEHCAEEVAQVKTMIDESCSKLSNLMHSISTFARISPDDAVIHPASVRIQTLLEKISGKYTAHVKKKEINITITSDNDAYDITTDPELLEITITCLLDNAVKYSPQETVVSINCTRDDSAEDERLLITVQDNGPGIDVDKKQLMFEWFRQGEDPLTRQHGGLGLGLPLAQRAVSLIDGTIDIRSGTTGGCCAEISLPNSVSLAAMSR